jgi:hypothetical protein
VEGYEGYSSKTGRNNSLLRDLSLIGSISGNPTTRTMSISLYFEQNGLQYNESINYSMECYGHFLYPTDTYKFLRNKTKDDINPPRKYLLSPELVHRMGAGMTFHLKSS